MLKEKISYRKYKLRYENDRMIGFMIYLERRNPTIDIYTGKNVHVWFWRRYE